MTVDSELPTIVATVDASTFVDGRLKSFLIKNSRWCYHYTKSLGSKLKEHVDRFRDFKTDPNNCQFR